MHFYVIGKQPHLHKMRRDVPYLRATGGTPRQRKECSYRGSDAGTKPSVRSTTLGQIFRPFFWKILCKGFAFFYEWIHGSHIYRACIENQPQGPPSAALTLAFLKAVVRRRIHGKRIWFQ